MSSGEVTVPADSFDKTKYNDPNVAPNPVNVTLGGNPQHWTASQPISRFDLKRDTSMDRIYRFDEYCKKIEEDSTPDKNTENK